MCFRGNRRRKKRQQRLVRYLILCKRANLAKSYGRDKRERQKGCEINKVWDPGVFSGVRLEECGLSNDQSTPSLLPWHLLVLQWPRPVWVWAVNSAHSRNPIRRQNRLTLGSRSNSDILQNVNVQPFLKVLLQRSFARRVRRVEMECGESWRGGKKREKKRIIITVLLEGGYGREGSRLIITSEQQVTLRDLWVSAKMFLRYRTRVTFPNWTKWSYKAAQIKGWNVSTLYFCFLLFSLLWI